MGNKKDSGSGFLIQGSILAIASIIVRVIGLFYRVPLNAILGDKGCDYYSTAYEIYSLLLIISSYSLPTAVSKVVSARLATGNRQNAYKVFRGALMLAFVTGIIAFLVVFFGAELITDKIFKTPEAYIALRVLAPALIIVAVMGVFRGFFQGHNTTMPSAISQILEGIIHAVVSVAGAAIMVSYAAKLGSSMPEGLVTEAYSAAGATSGTTVGAIAGLIFMIVVYIAYRPVMRKYVTKEAKRNLNTESYRQIIWVLIMTIIPILLSTTIYNISSSIDQGIFKNVALAQGYDRTMVSDYWGVYAGKYKVLINVPIAISNAVGAACVPSLTVAFANRDGRQVRQKIGAAMRFVLVIAFPCTVGITVLASPIINLLFHVGELELAALCLQLGSISVIFYSISTLSNAILQGIDRMRIPVRNALIALGLHIAFLLILMYGFKLHIYAVVLANAFFALVMCILNGLSVRKYSGYKQEIRRNFIIPLISSVIMGVICYLVYFALHKVTHSNAAATIIAILVAIVVYAIALLALKGLTEEELRSFPKGSTIIKIAKKFHLL